MTHAATSRAEYEEGRTKLSELRGKGSIAGSHGIGALTITVDHRKWLVTDGRHYYASGSITNPKGLMNNINRAIWKYLDQYRIK